MASPAFSALIFDCDGTLVDSEAIYADALWCALRDAGINLDPRMLRDQVVGVDNPTILEWVNSTFKVNLSSDFDALLEHYTDRAMRGNVRAVAGAQAVVRALSEAQVPLAVASNSSLRRVATLLSEVNLLNYFGGRIASRDQVEFPKPAPDIHLLAARQLGIAPQECLAVEDSVTGVRAARTAGMSVIGFSATGDQAGLVQAGAQAVICRLTALLNLDLGFQTSASCGGPIDPS